MCKNNIDFEKIAKSQRPYCVWIRAHDTVNAPLISVWIDPTATTFERQVAERRITDSSAPDSETVLAGEGEIRADDFDLPSLAVGRRAYSALSRWTNRVVNYSLPFALIEVN